MVESIITSNKRGSHSGFEPVCHNGLGPVCHTGFEPDIFLTDSVVIVFLFVISDKFVLVFDIDPSAVVFFV